MGSSSRQLDLTLSIWILAVERAKYEVACRDKVKHDYWRLHTWQIVGFQMHSTTNTMFNANSSSSELVLLQGYSTGQITWQKAQLSSMWLAHIARSWIDTFVLGFERVQVLLSVLNTWLYRMSCSSATQCWGLFNLSCFVTWHRLCPFRIHSIEHLTPGEPSFITPTYIL